MPVFFAVTLFVSSALLFLLQPMFAKMVLPLLGGTPAVWNTCMVFFQAALLAGYSYAHLAPASLGVRRQAIFHVGLLLLPVLALPIALPAGWSPPADANPISWLLTLLLVSVGLPFFVVSTSGPLLQKWFASTGHPAARDPYFLYGASNLGSMLALLAYPVLVEPALTLANQGRLWAAGYGLSIALMAGCAILLWRSPPPSTVHSTRPPPASGGLRTTDRLRWVALAFVPSSLMLSVTTYLTTEVAAIPLLWVIPLAIYLLSFILVFARKPPLTHRAMARAMPLVVVLMTLVMLSEATEPVWLLILLHLLGLFIIAMVCHGQLARSRPAAEHLTEFYLLLSVGGVLGGLFNALLSPLVFNAIVEYPLVLVLACLLRPGETAGQETKVTKGRRLASPPRHDAKGGKDTDRNGICAFLSSNGFKMDITLAVALGILTVVLVWAARGFGLGPWMARTMGLESSQVNVALIFGVPAVICYTFLHRPIRFGLGIAALFLAGTPYEGVHGTVLYRERSFFGIHRVTLDPLGSYHRIVHGSTVHGRQSLDPARRREPLAYYHKSGPIGQVFKEFSGDSAKPHVAIVGLGAGSIAAYGQPGQEFTFFEIDPIVIRIAQDERLFTFLNDSQAQIEPILVGDARLTLQRAPEHHYGLIIIDAFNSDAIPLHLLTREAVVLYKDKLAGDGILAFHFSNRYLDLEPVLTDLAADAKLVCRVQRDLELSQDEIDNGKSPSQWLIMAHKKAHFGNLAQDRRWQESKGRKDTAVWRDDFTNLFDVFKWR